MATVSPEVLNFNQQENIFNQHEGASFWIGRVSVGNLVTQPQLYNPLLKFRGQVYVNELGFVGTENLDKLGRESDSDDNRSALFAAVENQGIYEHQYEPKIIGSARLIVKDKTDNPLPIENHFPEIFSEKSAIVEKSAEASRYISRHPVKKIQRNISFLMISSLVGHSVENDIENVYAMMEKPLIKALGSVGLPMHTIGKPKQIDELNGELYPVLFHPFEIAEKLENENDVDASRLRKYVFYESGPKVSDRFVNSKHLGTR